MSDPVNPATPADPAGGSAQAFGASGAQNLPPTTPPYVSPPESSANGPQPMAQYPAPQQPPMTQYPTQPQQPGAPYGSPAPQVYIYGPPEQKKAPVFGILSIVFGVPSVFAAWTGIGLLATAAALVFGFIGKAKEPESRGTWLTGIILGFTGLAIAILVWIIFLVLGLSLFGAVSNLPSPPPYNY